MIIQRFLCKTKKYSITTTTLVVVMLLLFSPACTEKKKNIVEGTFNPDSSYIMRTTDAVTLISDSGVTRYRINAKDWLVFSKAKEPYSYFPEGIYVEKFDSLFIPEASIKADTAYFWDKKSLWRLIGNVEVVTLKNEKFETEELFWDQKKERIYSDKFVRIEKQDQVITGKHGFESNQDMTEYYIFNSQASFPVSEKDSTASTVQPADTIKNQTP